MAEESHTVTPYQSSDASMIIAASALVRVSNVGGADLVDLERVTLQYFFNGPQDLPESSDPISLFYLECLDTTTGKSLIWLHI